MSIVCCATVVIVFASFIIVVRRLRQRILLPPNIEAAMRRNLPLPPDIYEDHPTDSSFDATSVSNPYANVDPPTPTYAPMHYGSVYLRPTPPQPSVSPIPESRDEPIYYNDEPMDTSNDMTEAKHRFQGTPFATSSQRHESSALIDERAPDETQDNTTLVSTEEDTADLNTTLVQDNQTNKDSHDNPPCEAVNTTPVTYRNTDLDATIAYGDGSQVDEEGLDIASILTTDTTYRNTDMDATLPYGDDNNHAQASREHDVTYVNQDSLSFQEQDDDSVLQRTVVKAAERDASQDEHGSTIDSAFGDVDSSVASNKSLQRSKKA